MGLCSCTHFTRVAELRFPCFPLLKLPIFNFFFTSEQQNHSVQARAAAHLQPDRVEIPNPLRDPAQGWAGWAEEKSHGQDWLRQQVSSKLRLEPPKPQGRLKMQNQALNQGGIFPWKGWNGSFECPWHPGGLNSWFLMWHRSVPWQEFSILHRSWHGVALGAQFAPGFGCCWGNSLL